MKRYDKITPEGTKDLLFEECMARRRVETCWQGFFFAQRYREVVTPGLEFYDVFDPATSAILPQERCIS